MNIFSRRAIRLIIIGISVVLIVNLSRSIWDLWRRRDILGEREAVLQRIEAENKRLQGELEYAQSPEFIEQEARNRLGMGREGEAVVLMPNDNPPAGGPMTNGETEEKAIENFPNWKRWWGLFF